MITKNCIRRKMNKQNIIGFFLISLCVFLTQGCGDKFLDPVQVGRFRPTPAVNVILDSLGVAEEPPSTWEGAEEPKPIDLMVMETDYVFGVGDVVQISIFELFQENVVFASQYLVTETGKISIPEVGVIEVAGFTETQLEEEIKQILSPAILKDPSVTVSLVSSQKRTFSILGNGVPRPDRYFIPRYDFRLNDALASAGGINQFNISYVYVTRKVTGEEQELYDVQQDQSQPENEMLNVPVDEDLLEIIAPRVQNRQANELVISSAEFITDKELEAAALPDGFDADNFDQEKGQKNDLNESVSGKDYSANNQAMQKSTNQSADQGRIEWIFREGKWVPMKVGEPQGRMPEQQEKVAQVPDRKEAPAVEDFDWDEIGTGGVQTRVIKIPADKLAGGDPRYNIVIRPGDTIQVPVDIIGEFYIMGNVNFQGTINLTGRPMTLKMAIASAGGLGPLAWPKKCEIIRRISKDREQIVMVDLDKIFSGEQPDFYIKPNDIINIGTHSTSRWRAVLRNAFRATYGFGFVYDRNFADRDYGTSRPFPNWF